MKRLFLGLPVSAEIKKKVGEVAVLLKETGANLNFIQEPHFTIKFLGDVQESKIEEIKEKISDLQQPPFPIHLQSIGVFPKWDHINVIWVGVKESPLTNLMKEINQRLNYLRKDDREEVPHVTIARVKLARNKDRLKAVLEKLKNRDFGEMMVEKIILYESELRLEGPRYRELFRITFK